MLKFTVGMAVHDQNLQLVSREGRAVGRIGPELQRTVYTTMSLLTHHPHVGEVVWVDNNPQQVEVREGGSVRLVNPMEEWAKKCGGKVKYVPMPTPKGTTQPRNRVFEEASLDHVVCIDAHVLLYPSFFPSLERFYRYEGEDSPDLLHGPMMTESGSVMAEHMNDLWRAEMWGVWGRAWISPQGDDRQLFSTLTRDDQTLEYVTLGEFGTQRIIHREEAKHLGLPTDVQWPGHERALLQAGCRTLDSLEDHFPYFRVPGHGMGMFACRRDSWLQTPFNRDARGFGGEEMTTSARFVKHGKNVWCVQGARWWHHFERPGMTYRLTAWDKARNYVLAFQELGMDLAPVRQEFHNGRIPEGEWQQLLAGAIWPEPAQGVNAQTLASVPADLAEEMEARGVKYRPAAGVKAPEAPTAAREGFKPGLIMLEAPTPPQGVQNPSAAPITFVTNAAVEEPVYAQFTMTKEQGEECSPCQKNRTVAQVQDVNLDLLYKKAHETPGDINEHLPVLREMVKGLRVVEMGTRYATSTTAFLAGNPKSLITYDLNRSHQAKLLERFTPAGCHYEARIGDSTQVEIEECDLLFLDTDPHTAERVWAELTRHAPKVTSYIVLHDTEIFGERYGDQPGVLPAVRGFLSKNPEWTSIRHYENNNGLTVLSRRDEDKKHPPGLLAKALNFGKAWVRHARAGFTPTPDDVRNKRIELCVMCDQRFHDVCGACGCPIQKKAGWNEETCPHPKGPKWAQIGQPQPE